MSRTFTIAEAQALLPLVIDRAAQIIQLRADLSDAQLALQRGEPATVGGIPEIKAVEARLQEALDWFGTHGIDVKGIAPLIIDFPSHHEGEPTLLCWLEGETEIAWHHPPATGFMGRRPLDLPGAPQA